MKPNEVMLMLSVPTVKATTPSSEVPEVRYAMGTAEPPAKATRPEAASKVSDQVYVVGDLPSELESRSVPVADPVVEPVVVACMVLMVGVLQPSDSQDSQSPRPEDAV